MIYEYKCTKCEHTQEVVHKLDEKNTEKCEKCEAPPEDLTRVINCITPKHGSWSRWQV